jgi:hypothetical protein
VGKRTVAQSRNNYTQQRDRDERDHPWVVVITLSSEMMGITGKRLGKTAGQEVLSFQRRDAPLEIQNRMHQQIRAWRAARSRACFAPLGFELLAGYLFGVPKISLLDPKIGAASGCRGMFGSNESTATAAEAQVYCL